MAVKDGVATAASGVAGFAQKTAEGTVQVVKDGVLGGAELAGQAAVAVKDGVATAASFAQKTAGDAVGLVKDGAAIVGNGAEKVASAVKDGADMISSGIKQAKDSGQKLAGLVTDTGRSLWQRFSGKKES